ncbi:MAG TPA: D-alanine--D-alanine ligase family protein [Pseudobacteroides sp.]|uniref:D-alanine--D-alanine ligase family protein n=1 Tax=Pseudobacteroides sp. TaxID=1968840 RepID=UPI002F94B1FE
MDKKTRVAVIFGGQSTEHEVSRVSAESVIRNINRDKFEVVMIGITKEGKWLRFNGPVEKLGSGEWEQIALEESLAARQKCILDQSLAGSGSQNVLAEAASARSIFNAAGVGEDNGQGIDVVFPVLHGSNGEDGTIQGLFELAGIPYVGPGVLASAVGMDKAYTKIVFEKEGIPQGKYLVFNRKALKANVDDVVSKVEGTLTYPCFVKPSNSGSSVGVGKARNRQELIDTMVEAAKYDRKLLVEEFIDGREVECAVLGNDEPIASTVGEVVPCNEFYDYKAKYIDNNSRITIPADLPESTIKEIRDYAVRAFKSLDCAGLSRVDFFVHKGSGNVYINEINTLPGFTSISMYPKLWEASGIPYDELIERLIDLAVERFNDKTL